MLVDYRLNVCELYAECLWIRGRISVRYRLNVEYWLNVGGFRLNVGGLEVECWRHMICMLYYFWIQFPRKPLKIWWPVCVWAGGGGGLSHMLNITHGTFEEFVFLANNKNVWDGVFPQLFPISIVCENMGWILSIVCENMGWILSSVWEYGLNIIHSVWEYGLNIIHSVWEYGLNSIHSVWEYGLNIIHSVWEYGLNIIHSVWEYGLNIAILGWILVACWRIIGWIYYWWKVVGDI